MSLNRKREDILGRGQPIPEDVVRSFCKKGHLQQSSSFFESFSSSLSLSEEDDFSDVDSTPTINLLKAAKKSFISFVSLDFLIGNMNDLRTK